MAKIPVRKYTKHDGTRVSEHVRNIESAPKREKFEEPTLEIYIIKKHHTTMGAPVYTLFIPTEDGKIEGLRKLSTKGYYSHNSYNPEFELRNYVFKGRKLKIVDQR